MANFLLQKSMAASRHAEFVSKFTSDKSTLNVLFNFEDLQEKSVHKPFLAEEDVVKNKYLKFCRNLNAKTTLLELKTSQTFEEVHKKISEKVKLLNLVSLFPLLQAKLIYKFLVMHSDEETPLIHHVFSEKEDSKTKHKVLKSDLISKNYLKVESEEEFSYFYFSVLEFFKKLTEYFQIDCVSFADEIETFSKQIQLQIYVVYLYYVCFFDAFEGKLYKNHSELFQKKGQVILIQFSDSNFGLSNLKVGKDLDIPAELNLKFSKRQENLKNLDNLLTSSKSTLSIKQQVDEKIKKAVIDVSSGVFMCKFCKKFFQSREFTVNHINHKHEEEYLKYSEKFRYKSEMEFLKSDEFLQVFSKIENMKIHYQPFSRNEDFNFNSKRIKTDGRQPEKMNTFERKKDHLEKI